jgi:neutral trehalase
MILAVYKAEQENGKDHRVWLARAYTFAARDHETSFRLSGAGPSSKSKYRVTDAPVTSGYNVNVVGFGWTNTAYLEFLKELLEARRSELSTIH